MTDASLKINLIKNLIENYEDFPRPGVLFLDIFPVLRKPEAFNAICDLFYAHCAKHISNINAICAVESRGFLFGPLLSLKFGIPFIPIRKKGKLPGEVHGVSYNMEYTSSVLEVQKNALPPGSNVIIVDDVAATGGTLAAVCDLMKTLGANVDHCLVVIEIEKLESRKNLPCPLYSLFKM